MQKLGIFYASIYFLILYVLIVAYSNESRAGTFNEYDLATNSITLETPHAFYNKNDKEWSILIDKIRYTPANLIILVTQGEGGFVDKGLKVSNVISDAMLQGKVVKVVVVGYTASMSANLACFNTQLHMQKGSLLFFHLMSDGIDGPVLISDEFMDMNRTFFDVCVASGVMTADDRERILEGHTLTIYPDGKKKFEKDNRPRI